MQTEHLSNIHPGWVVGGWLVAISVTAAVYLGGVGLGLVLPGDAAFLWIAFSCAVGFFVGGLLVGFRWMDAPILHAAALSIFSVLVLFLVTLFGDVGRLEREPAMLGLILVQLLASMIGGSTGRRLALGRTPPLG